MSRAELTLKESRSLLSKGMASDADTLRAFVALENLRPELLKMDNQVCTGKVTLAHLMGLDATDNFELSDSLTYQVADPMDTESSYQQALGKRADVQIAEQQRILSLQQQQANKARFMPELSLISQYQWQSQSDDLRFGQYNWPENAFIGLQLNIPIFSGFGNEARLQQSKIANLQAEQQVLQMRRQVRTEVVNAKASMDEAAQRIAFQQKTIKAAERSYGLTASRYRNGLARFADVSDADLALTQAKTNYLQAVYDYLIFKSEYQRVMGME
jgi:outer membrane protein TolC